jgi:hypothetical protein
MMCVCLFRREVSDFGVGNYEGRRISECDYDQRNVTPPSSG